MSVSSIDETSLDAAEKGARPPSKADTAGPLGVCDTATLVFSDIQYRVSGAKGSKLDILKGITGFCRGGRLLALMGASGAGKTSLIDILAGQVRTGVTGKMTINGLPLRAADFQKRSCYVLQRDVLLATATVQEAVTTSALLKLPQSMPRAEKNERVIAVIQQLELEKCAETLVGDDSHGIKGISGGERRRLSVAIGLVTDPQIILLDEPTSGLDSSTAAQLIGCLVKLARANRTVVASIHQPNSQITEGFDDLMLLHAGRTAYFGPWQTSMAYFDSVNHPCPMYTNPSDHYLLILKEAGDYLTKIWADSATAKANLTEGYQSMPNTPGRHSAKSPLFSKAWFNSSILASPTYKAKRKLVFGEDDVIRVPKLPFREESQAATHVHIPSISEEGTSTPCSTEGTSTASFDDSYTEPAAPKPTTSWFFQMRVLSVRFLRSWLRSPDLLISFLAQYLFAGVFLGLMYLQLGTSRTSSIFDRQSSLFLALVMLVFTPGNTACTVWESERLLLRREANSGAYRLSTFFAAKTLVTFPMQAVVAVIFCLLMYFMVGYQYVAGKFGVFLAVAALVQFISETIGCVSAILTKTATVGILVATSILTILVAFSGFLISHTPVFFRWIAKMSFVSFAYSALYQNEFDGLQMKLAVPAGQPSSSAGLVLNLANSEYQCLPTGARSTSRGPNGNNFTIGRNIGILVGILIGLRLFTFVLLQAAYKLKRL